MTSFTINTRVFDEVMQTASVMAGLHKGMLMLDSVCLNVKDGILTITSTDTEAYVSRTVRIENPSNEEDIDVLVNPKDICQLLPLITDENVTIEFEGGVMTLRHTNGFLSTATNDASEFPTLPTDGYGYLFSKLTPDRMSAAVKKAVNFASNDMVRPVMCSVVFHFDDEGFYIYASDGVTLFMQDMNDSMNHGSIDLIIPRKSVRAIVNMLKTCSNFRGVAANDKFMKFVFDEGFIVSCLVDGKYPNVKKVIPKTFSKIVNVKKSALMDSIKRVSLSAGENRMIRFATQRGLRIIDISSDDTYLCKKSKESVSAEIMADDDLVIGFNADNIIKALSNLYGENVVIKMNESNMATLWSCEEDASTKILIMPTRIE